MMSSSESEGQSSPGVGNDAGAALRNLLKVADQKSQTPAKNLDPSQSRNLDLRDEAFKACFKTLWIEILFLNLLILLQGFEFFGFKLNEWIFALFVSGVLLQTFFLLSGIIGDLYPKGRAMLNKKRPTLPRDFEGDDP